MTAYFEQEQYKKDCQSKKNLKFCKAYHDCIKACQSNSSEYKPKKIMKLTEEKFDPDDEHDSQEFLRFFLSGMEEELNKKNKKKCEEWKHPKLAWDYFALYQTSIIDKLFCGMFVNRVKCTNCKNVSESFDPFLDISLSIQS